MPNYFLTSHLFAYRKRAFFVSWQKRRVAALIIGGNLSRTPRVTAVITFQEGGEKGRENVSGHIF
jgi:hypothetical protein